ncbi:hypothetical protein [Sorangium sp. So ce1151]|uniref:hypothetical protein n=1 Tax=Sorangium sp. So ce1151 TaxID=3133332 RepID=UPI003F5E4D7A
MSVARITAGVSLATLFLSINACGGDSDPSEGEPPKRSVEELASCDESDFLNDMPWSGTAIDPETGELKGPLPAGYMIATTVGWPMPEHRQEMIQETIESIGVAFTYPGILAASFGNSVRCGSGRSISIWSDSASMVGWASSKDHRDYVPLVVTHTYGWETTHWAGTELERLPTFDEAREHLDAARAKQ